MYHPGLGRFLQPDPIGFEAKDMNLFRYCGGDPVNRVDPMGLEDIGIPEAMDIAIVQTNYASAVANRGTGGHNHIVIYDKAGGGFQPAKATAGVTHPTLNRGASVLPTNNVWEKTVVPRGRNPRGVGHAHDDLASDGKTVVAKSSRYTGVDKKQAVDLPVGKVNWSSVNTSAPNGIHTRLTPQDDGTAAEDRKISARIVGKALKGMQTLEDIKQGRSSSSANDNSSQSQQAALTRPMTAAEIDQAHQATGVPSLGVETVNAVHGKC
jgi:hypothetical protein